MALQLISAITLDRDYGISQIDNTYVSNLNNSLSNSDVVTKATNSLFQGTTYVPGATYNFISQHSINADIDFEYGQNFRIEFDIVLNQSIKLGVAYFNDGVYQFGFQPNVSFPESYPPSLLVPSGTTHISIDNDSSTLEFDEVRVYYFLINSGYTTSTVSNFEVNGLDVDNSFDTGDRVITYWDDVANSYQVQREDNPGNAITIITNGPELGRVERDQVSGVLFSRGPTGDKLEQTYGARSEYKFCSGLNLVEFFFSLETYSFPYVFRFDTENSTACTPGNIVCDVVFNANPVITPATNRYSNDGQVSLSATSSHEDFLYPIKYSNKSPETFLGLYANILDADASNVKTGLSVGNHTFYAVDRYNCWAVIQVAIPSQPSTEYGEKYRLQYFDIQTGIQSVIKIFERGYDGVVNDVKGTGDPFTLGKSSGDINNKFETLKSTFCNFAIVTERNFQYIGLFSQDDRKYKVAYIHGDSVWYGFLTPSLYQEPYSPSPIYPISITATDNLSSIGDKDFVDESGNVMTGLRSVLTLVALILKKLDLNLNIISAVNRFALGMSIADTDDPLAQTYINTDAFVDENGNPFKCDVVLESLLKPFGCFVQQDSGKWIIADTDSQTQDYTYREFSPSGVYISNGTIVRPDIDIVSPSHVFGLPDGAMLANSDQTLDIVPAYGEISITHTLKPVRSIFPTSLDRWQPNISSGANATPYDIDGTKDKGISFTNVTSRQASLISPLFTVKTRTDSVSIKFDYKHVFMPDTAPFYDPVTGITFGSLSLPFPPYMKLIWRLVLRVAGTELYYSERAGWTKTDYIGTSTSTVSIPTNGAGHPSSRTFTTQAGLGINPGSLIKLVPTDNFFYFIRGIVSAYNNDDGVLTFDTYSSYGGSASFSSWVFFIGGSEYIDNYIIRTDFKESKTSFDTEVNLPSFSDVTTVQLQLQIVVEGSKYFDFNNETQLKELNSAVYNTDYKVRGKSLFNPDFYQTTYTLNNGTDAEDSPEVIRSNDYNNNSNAVVWKWTDVRYVKDVAEIDIENVIVNFLPNKQNPIESETLTFTNNANYKENLNVPISSGDIPTSIISDEIYTSIFRLSNGTPTKNWKRKLISENSSLQSLLLKNLGNQYNKPTWRITGSLLIADAKFTSIVKQTIPSVEITVLNQEFDNITNWTNFDSGESWYYPGGNRVLCENLGIGGNNNSQYLRQPVSDLTAGIRIRIDFKITREDVDTYGNSRTDRFVCVLWNNLTMVQKIVLYDGIQSEGDYIRGVLFNLDQDATHISFRVENIITDEGVANYYCDYFIVKGISVVRYYYFNSYSRNDRHNMYNAELVQLIPMIASTDTDIDDTGGGNTGGEDDNGGNNGGQPFNGAFSSDWGGNFDTILN